jgi:hypothetical protein
MSETTHQREATGAAISITPKMVQKFATTMSNHLSLCRQNTNLQETFLGKISKIDDPVIKGALHNQNEVIGQARADLTAVQDQWTVLYDAINLYLKDQQEQT